MKTPFWWQSRTLLSTCLLPLAAVYRAGATRRIQRLPAFKASVPVLCVGNVVAGGAGKTPAVIALTRLLKQQGKNPAVLSRGYGGTLAGPVQVDISTHTAAQVGDEALLLAAEATTIISRDRALGAKLAVSLGADLLLMDDGLQNPSLHKDKQLLVVDGAYGFGNGRMLPAGPLREPVEDALERADAVLIIGDTPRAEVADALRAAPKTIFRARLETVNAPDFKGRRCLAFAGIGRPEKFFDSLAACGADVIATHPFADHHPFCENDMLRLAAQAKQKNAELVTTRKDSVRLPAAWHKQVRVLDVALTFNATSQPAVNAWLDEVMHA